MALIVHPDKHPNEYKNFATEAFKYLQQIHHYLRDEEWRRHYDDYVSEIRVAEATAAAAIVANMPEKKLQQIKQQQKPDRQPTSHQYL